MTSKDILLYSQILALFSCRQRWFLPKQMRTNRDPQPPQYAESERDLGALSPKQDVFLKSLSSELRRLYKSRGIKCTRATGDGGHKGIEVFYTA